MTTRASPPPSGQQATHVPPGKRLARLVTEVFAPATVAGLLLLVVAIHSARSVSEAVVWGLIAVLFASLLPMLYIIRGVRRRRLSDHHVGVRTQRPLPLLVGAFSVAVGTALLTFLHAPRDLVALIGAMAAGLLTSLLVTLFWKISVHVAVGAGAIVILTLVFGPPLLFLTPLVALIGWARVELGDHTPVQVVAGSGLGTLVAAAVFVILR